MLTWGHGAGGDAYKPLARIDRYHPLGLPFQRILDGGDPLPDAPQLRKLVKIFAGFEDSPGTGRLRAVAGRGPVPGTLFEYPPREFDGHLCAYSEPTALEVWRRFAEGL